MNKKILIAVLVLVVIFVGGYFLTQETSEFINSPISLPEIAEKSNSELIEEAFLGSGSISCNYTTPESEYQESMKATSYIKNGRIRVFFEDVEVAENEILFVDNTYYFWQGSTGMKMSVKDNDLLPFGVDNGEVNILEEEFSDLECKRESFDDGIFEIPNDVEFYDMSGNVMDFQIEE